MARKRHNRKPKQKDAQEKINDSIETKEKSFVWNNKRIIALLNCMIRRKPAGLHKHMNMILIKTHLSKRLNIDVPIKEIWSFLNAHWNMHEADKIEFQSMKIEKKDFELPKTEDWTRLIEEQKALFNSNNINTDAIKRKSQTAISKMDSKTLKSVKVMVEKLDSHSMYAYKLSKIN